MPDKSRWEPPEQTDPARRPRERRAPARAGEPRLRPALPGAGLSRERSPGRAGALARFAAGSAGAVVLALGFSCGGPDRPVREPAAPSPKPDRASVEPTPMTPPDEPRPTPTPAEAVSEDECATLLTHVIEVANVQHLETVAPEHAPTAEQLAEIEERMAPEFIPVCLQFDRAVLECQMQATTRDALVACMPP